MLEVCLYMTVLMEGISFGESPRWHDGRLWFSDWGAHQVIALDPDGGHEVVVSVPSFPMCIDFLPDGRLLVVDSAQRRLLRREPDGSMVTHADLAPISEKPWNDIVVDARGNAYVNNIGFDFPGGEPAPGCVALVTPDGRCPSGRRRPRLPQRHGDHRRWRHADRGRVPRATGSPPTTSAATATWPTGARGRTPGMTTPTGSASMPRAPSGTPTWVTSTACGCVRAARFWPRWNSTAAPSPARSAAAIDPQLYVVGQKWGGPQPTEPTGQIVVFPAPAPGAGKP